MPAEGHVLDPRSCGGQGARWRMPEDATSSCSTHMMKIMVITGHHPATTMQPHAETARYESRIIYPACNSLSILICRVCFTGWRGPGSRTLGRTCSNLPLRCEGRPLQTLPFFFVCLLCCDQARRPPHEARTAIRTMYMLRDTYLEYSFSETVFQILGFDILV